jgi:hypothetical protein
VIKWTISKSAFFAVGMAEVTDWNVIIRHIFGAANRKKSEKYGLVVYLCGNRCHRLGEYSVHQNADVMEYLHRYGQEKAMQEQGWTTEKFIKEFGKNYL